jgi:hypothetical protein
VVGRVKYPAFPQIPEIEFVVVGRRRAKGPDFISLYAFFELGKVARFEVK